MRKSRFKCAIPLLMLFFVLAIPPLLHGQATIQGGVPSGTALNLPAPEYPEAAKPAGVTGLVVAVLASDSGNVTPASQWAKIIAKGGSGGRPQNEIRPHPESGPASQSWGHARFRFQTLMGAAC